MKAILSLILVFVISSVLFAQSTAKASTGSSSCFKEWYTLFKDRGANPLADGTHDVIITLRQGDYAQCFMGKIDVVDSKISSKLQIQKMDGSFAEFDKKVSAALTRDGVLKEELRDISNGMSASINMEDGEIVRLFFYKSLAEKPKANKKAPSPSELIKN